MKKLIFFTFVLIAGFGLSTTSLIAQDASDSATAKKHGITFPIVELGNCGSITECKSYCSDQNHADACIAYAKQKGFYKENQQGERKQKLLQAAQDQLGCQTEQECRQFCSLEANRERCQTFAQQHGVDTHPQSQHVEEIHKKAQEILGCNTPDECRAFCQQEVNREKCQAFAQSAGLKPPGQQQQFGGPPGNFGGQPGTESGRFGNQREFGQSGGNGQGDLRGPGGCTSQASCREYCSDSSHATECKRFMEQQQNRGTNQNQFPGDQNQTIHPRGGMYGASQGGQPRGGYPQGSSSSGTHMYGQGQGGQPGGGIYGQNQGTFGQPSSQQGGYPQQPGEPQQFGGQQPYAGQQQPLLDGDQPEVYGLSTSPTFWERVYNFISSFWGTTLPSSTSVSE